MESRRIESGASQNEEKHWLPENTIEIEQRNFLVTTEKISTDPNCRFPQLTLRIFNHVTVGIDATGKNYISARWLSKKLGANYDTVTKCLKYLRGIGVVRIEW